MHSILLVICELALLGAAAAIAVETRPGNSLSVGAVSRCISQNYAFDCPSWDKQCQASLSGFTQCLYGTAHPECVEGNEELRYLSSRDPYPDKLVACSQLCNPQSPSAFFVGILYSTYVSCQTSGSPSAPAQFTWKGTQNSVLQKTCLLSAEPSFAETFVNYTNCLFAASNTNFLLQCNSLYAQLADYDAYPFCRYASQLYCAPDPQAQPQSFKDYFTCLNNSQFQSSIPTPTVAAVEKCMAIQCVADCPAWEPSCKTDAEQFKMCYYGN